MTTERREDQRYAEYQRSRRGERVQALGNVVTNLVLATIGLGVLPLGEANNVAPAKEKRRSVVGEALSLAAQRRRAKLGSAAIATDVAELGRARAA